jgi:hypothetical protein
MSQPIRCLLAALPLICVCCSLFEVAGGGGSQTGNGTTLTGIVSGDSGGVSAGAAVFAYPADYDPALDSSGSVYQAATDVSGRYRMRLREAGRYNVFASDSGSGRNALLLGIAAGKEQETILERAILRAPGSVTVPLAEGPHGLDDWFFLEGTDFSRQIDSRALEMGRIVFRSVPAGRLPRLMYLRAGTASAMPIADSLLVASGKDSEVGRYWAWPYKRAVTVHPERGGLAPADTLLGFPILIRLARDGFDFSRARADGADLRVTKGESGPELPFQIERWDSAGGRGEIWVRADSLFGAAPSRFVLHAGNHQAASLSDGGAVFDTASGFAGVWHLAGKGPLFQDATAHGFHGTGTAVTAAEGVLGAGQAFGGAASLIRVPHAAGLNFGTGDFTASAWIKTVAPVGGENREIFAKRDSAVGNWELQLQGDNRPRAYLRGSSMKDTLNGLFPLSAGEWHFVALSRRAGWASLFIDGAEGAGHADSLNVSSPADLIIGADGSALATGNEDPEWFQGIIDEVVVSGRSRPAAWLRFAHGNQEPGSRVIEIGP